MNYQSLPEPFKRHVAYEIKHRPTYDLESATKAAQCAVQEWLLTYDAAPRTTLEAITGKRGHCLHGAIAMREVLREMPRIDPNAPPLQPHITLTEFPEQIPHFEVIVTDDTGGQDVTTPWIANPIPDGQQRPFKISNIDELGKKKQPLYLFAEEYANYSEAGGCVVGWSERVRTSKTEREYIWRGSEVVETVGDFNALVAAQPPQRYIFSGKLGNYLLRSTVQRLSGSKHGGR